MRHSPLILGLYILTLLLGFTIFFRGFLVIKSPIPGYASWKDTLTPRHTDVRETGVQFPQNFQRLIIVLVDALRADFALPTKDTKLPHMRFVRHLINNNQTISFIGKASPPTVTLPRIKALTTGGIPGFVDVVLNFDSEDLEEDNLISQFHRNNRKIVFYGDDTWIKLFPKHFLRSDGTTSFFVTDYTEVDNNVTRHLDKELASSEWDLLVLHYLGLDHIGHLAGPSSPLVEPKLNEMDDIVRRIYEELLKLDQASGTSSLLLLCGDHGMSDQGSHGGASVQETSTPLVFISPKWHDGTGEHYTQREVDQVDVAPTLALVSGLPIPQNSLGSILLPVFRDYSLEHQMTALYLNAQQLIRVFRQMVSNHEREPSYERLLRAVAAHQAWVDGDHHTERAARLQAAYVGALRAMRARLAEALTKYDLHAMGSGIALLWLVLLGILFDMWSSDYPTGGLSITAFMSTVGCALLTGVHLILCTSSSASSLLCRSEFPSVSLSLFALLLGCANVLNIVLRIKEIRLTNLKILLTMAWPVQFLLVGTVGHTASLLASSFVEEEHQTWYFLTTTVTIIFGASIAASSLDRSGPTSPLYDPLHDDAVHSERVGVGDGYCHGFPKELLQIRAIRNLHSQCYLRTHKEMSAMDNKSREKREGTANGERLLSQLITFVTVLATCRLARAWNRTGDKWAHIPDIGDWLVRPENQVWLSVVTIISLCTICAARWRRACTWTASNLLLGGAAGVYCFRSATGALWFPWLYEQIPEKGVVEARAVYTVVCLMIGHAVRHYRRNSTEESSNISRTAAQQVTPAGSQRPSHPGRRTTFIVHLQLCWTLLSMLLLRPHNIALIAFITLMEIGVRLAMQRVAAQPVWPLTLLYLWFGQACFFYQGNSNSISSVDISSGYVGLHDYEPGLVAVLIGLCTYAGPVFWLLSLTRLLSEKYDLEEFHARRWRDVLDEASWTLVASRALPLAVYTLLTTVQRYHLFVWTVFSPKLLYEGIFTICIFAVVLLMQLLKYL